jgi:AbrB family looped-hinge helix DNA binding protein
LEASVQAVKISPKFQVVIPRQIRESMHLRAGQKMQVVEYGNRIEFVPVKRMKELRGFTKGINTGFDRENDRL